MTVHGENELRRGGETQRQSGDGRSQGNPTSTGRLEDGAGRNTAFRVRREIGRTAVGRPAGAPVHFIDPFPPLRGEQRFLRGL